MVNYANGGSTCNPLHKRKCQHKKDSKKGTERPVYRHLNAIGWDNVEIILVESFLVIQRQNWKPVKDIGLKCWNPLWIKQSQHAHPRTLWGKEGRNSATSKGVSCSQWRSWGQLVPLQVLGYCHIQPAISLQLQTKSPQKCPCSANFA